MGGGQELSGGDLGQQGGAAFGHGGKVVAQPRGDAALLWERRKGELLPSNLPVCYGRVEGALHNLAEAANKLLGLGEREQKLRLYLAVGAEDAKPGAAYRFVQVCWYQCDGIEVRSRGRYKHVIRAYNLAGAARRFFARQLASLCDDLPLVVFIPISNSPLGASFFLISSRFTFSTADKNISGSILFG